MTLRKSLQLGVGAALALLFLWLIVRQVRPDEIKHALAAADVQWILCALLTFVAGYACRIERWRLMLKRENPALRWRDCAGPFLAGFAMNNVLPFRAGDVLRAFAFVRALGATSGAVIATLFVERLLDLLMVLILLGAALAALDADIAWISGIGGWVLLAIAAMISLVLLFPALLTPCVLLASRFTARTSRTAAGRISAEIDKAVVMLQYLGQGRTMLKLMSWSVLAWTAEGLVFYLIGYALPPITTPHAAWLALPMGTLATLIPSTPGYVGTFDYFVLRSMTELGNPAAAATAYAVLVHSILWLPPTLAGGLYLLLRSHSGRLAVSGS